MTKEEAREMQAYFDQSSDRHEQVRGWVNGWIFSLPDDILSLFGIKKSKPYSRGDITMYGKIQVLRQVVVTPSFLSRGELPVDGIIGLLECLNKDDVYGFVCGDDPLEVRRRDVLPGCNNTACGSSKVGFNYLVSGGERGHGGKFCCHQCGSLFS